MLAASVLVTTPKRKKLRCEKSTPALDIEGKKMATELSDITARISALEAVLLALLEHGVITSPAFRQDLSAMKQRAAETVCEMYGEGVPRDYQKTAEEYIIQMVTQPLECAARPPL